MSNEKYNEIEETKLEFMKNVCENCENLYTCDNNYYEGKIEDCMKEYENNNNINYSDIKLKDLELNDKIRLLNNYELEIGECGQYEINNDEGINSIIEEMEYNDYEIDLYITDKIFNKPILYCYGGGRGLESISLKELDEHLECIRDDISSNSELRCVLSDCLLKDINFD